MQRRVFLVAAGSSLLAACDVQTIISPPPDPGGQWIPLRIVSISEKVAQGDTAILTVISKAGVQVTPTVKRGNQVLQVESLAPQAVDDTNTVTWRWTVPPNLQPGRYILEVTAEGPEGKVRQSWSFEVLAPSKSK
jgi:hypothetical protein